MKITTKLQTLAAFVFAVLLSTSSLLADLGQWDFNSSNLTATAGATLGDLTFKDGGGGATELATQFGTTTSFGIPNINGTPAIVMKTPGPSYPMGYLMPTPTGANGGGGLVNQWTILFDVLYPAASDGTYRAFIQTDGGLTPDADFFVNPGGGIGIGGIYDGVVNPNTWYRIGFVVDQSAGVNQIRKFINGVEVGNQTAGGVDGRWGLALSTTAAIVTDDSGDNAPGYFNSIQLRDVALNPGQMETLGAASAAGIPTTAVPFTASYIDTRTPGPGQGNLPPSPSISIVLKGGDTTITPGSIKLRLDAGAPVGSVAGTDPYTITYAIPTLLVPNSFHSLSLEWNDSAVGNKTNTWFFTVGNYQNVTLPAPFYFQDFDSLTEDPTPGVALPAGWTVNNQTAAQTPGFDLADRSSDSYKDWILVSNSRFTGWDANRTALPPIVLNGTLLSSLTSGNLLWAESDSRCGGCNGQFANLFTGPISCTGKTNVFVAFKSIYMQNQDNSAFLEYTVDGGTNWLPVVYFLMYPGDGQESIPDVVYTNGVIDVSTTFSRVDNNRNWSPDTSPTHATNYGSYISAPLSAIKPANILGRINDSNVDGKRIELFRLPAADGKPDVRFRFNNNGTSSWFWGIDDFGLYEINTPVITAQPQPQTVSAGDTATFTVTASSSSTITYKWQHGGTNISNGGHYFGVLTSTLTVSSTETNDAGLYSCLVSNASGGLSSGSALLTVVTDPQIIVQPQTMVRSIGFPGSFTVTAMGRPPLHYQWLKGVSPVGLNSSTLSFLAVQPTDAGTYQVVITNGEGTVSSALVRLIVAPSSITSNLVVHLKFDGDYLDSSGHGNNASAVGAPTVTSAGKIGNAMKFTTRQDGSEFSYATLNYPADLLFGDSTDFSTSFWVNYTLDVDDPPFLSNKDWLSSDNPGWIIADQAGNGNFRINITGGANKFNTTATPVVRGGWHNIVVSVARGGVVSTYVDGAPVSTLPINTTASIDTDGLGYAVNVGQDGTGGYTDNGGMGVTNALIDDVGIWRRALSSQEAAAISSAGQAGQHLELAVAASSLGTLTVSTSGGTVSFAWVGGTGIRLQRTAILNPASWSDVGGTLGNSSYSEPAATAGKSFFRLFKP